MEEICKHSPTDDAKDSPSANTRSKSAVEQNMATNLSNATPTSSKQPLKRNTKKGRTPVSGGSGTTKSDRNKLSEIRAAALKKKREDLTRGTSTPQQALYDPDSTARNAKDIIRGETGLIIDELMERHYNPWDENHIERPERLRYIRERFKELGLIEKCTKVRIIGRVLLWGVADNFGIFYSETTRLQYYLL